MPSPLWKGDSAGIHEQPGSPRVQLTGTGTRTTHTFRGPYTALLDAAPAVGSTYSGSLGKVETVDIVPDGAGIDGPGTMIFVLADDQVTYEIDVGTLEKPLIKHPLFNTGGDHALDDAQRDKIENWRNATTSAERSTAYATLDAHGKAFCDKLRAGEEAYLLPAPIARKTTRSYAKPATAGMGKTGDPAGFPDLPAGYQWLKTADRACKQGIRGSWEQVEEWTGAESWDPDLYPAA